MRCGRDRERREHPCSRCCEPLLRFRGAPAQHDLLVRVSILITCEYYELFSLSALTNGANCPYERWNVENTRVNVGPVRVRVRVRAAATRRAATVTRFPTGNVVRSCSPVRFVLASASYRLKYAVRDGPQVPGERRDARRRTCPTRTDPTPPGAPRFSRAGRARDLWLVAPPVRLRHLFIVRELPATTRHVVTLFVRV